MKHTGGWTELLFVDAISALYTLMRTYPGVSDSAHCGLQRARLCRLDLRAERFDTNSPRCETMKEASVDRATWN